MSLLVVGAGLATGIMLGLLGSGGSIIALPALIYLLGIATKPAIGMSLGVVGITAAISAVTHWRRGNVDPMVAAVFGLFGVAGTHFGARIGVVTPELVQLLLFATVMYAAAYRMFRPSGIMPQGGDLVWLDCSGEKTVCFNAVRTGYVAALGLGVGALTGIVGVGGGFLILPALVLLAGIPMKAAVGTSLLIVAANAVTGFLGYAGAVGIDYRLMGTFTAVAIAGSFAGAAVSKHLDARTLKRAFAVFLVIVATWIIVRETILK
ncbi:MAG: sulfite exporter TauE/SafE family protein [Magnetospirillum sp.]|nr:sulfite exporter TauE/SafE family protein [Magnetospirillum sp.]